MEKLEKLLRYIIINMLHMKFLEEKWDFFFQFVKFGIVGVSNTLLSYVIYTIGLLGLRELNLFENMDYIIAQFISFTIGVMWSFFWNNKMVFTLEDGKERSIIKAFMKTYISYSFTGLFLNSIFLVLWVQILGISEFIAPFINLIISVPTNFLINKFWAFKTEE